ncbi:MAG TPA: pitrilysin family protein, partial [Thermodesulfobacteriota bacterium]|nr:pitrilysin family protein [Thermodesulfobacteriota bacterium]
MRWRRRFSRLMIFFSGVLLFSPPCGAETRKDTLPNGLTYLVLKNAGTASVAVDLWIRVGSRNEAPEKNGISHFVEHLLFKGTATRSAREISRQLSSVGGSINASTQWEYTQVHISILPAHLPLALEILADMARNSVMSKDMVEKERKVILEEISLGKIYPPAYVLNLVTRSLFRENPLQMPISGTAETVKSIGVDDLRSFYRRHYVPNNCFLSVVGNVDPDRAGAAIEERFASWPRGEERVSPPPAPTRQQRFQEVSERKFLDQAIVVLAVQAMGIRDKDRAAFDIVNTALGAGGNSRLYHEIREKKGLSYLVGSMYYPLSDTGLWGIY